jgi:hypothetical protein
MNYEDDDNELCDDLTLLGFCKLDAHVRRYYVL